MADLESKLKAAAYAYAPLTALIGTGPYGWMDTQLSNAAAATFPAVVVFQVSNPKIRGFGGVSPTSWKRMQFTIWGISGVQARAVEAVMYGFLAQFNGYGIANLPANASAVIDVRSGLYAETQPPKYLRIMDAMIFDNSNF
jgi:hypothetical protein